MLNYSKPATFAFAIIFSAAISSCSAPTKSWLAPGDAKQTKEINSKSQDSPAYIRFVNGYATYGYRVTVKPDSTEWYVTNTLYSRSSGLVDSVFEERYVVPTSKILSISFSATEAFGGLFDGTGSDRVGESVSSAMASNPYRRGVNFAIMTQGLSPRERLVIVALELTLIYMDISHYGQPPVPNAIAAFDHPGWWGNNSYSRDTIDAPGPDAKNRIEYDNRAIMLDQEDKWWR